MSEYGFDMGRLFFGEFFYMFRVWALIFVSPNPFVILISFGSLVLCFRLITLFLPYIDVLRTG